MDSSAGAGARATYSIPPSITASARPHERRWRTGYAISYSAGCRRPTACEPPLRRSGPDVLAGAVVNDAPGASIAPAPRMARPPCDRLAASTTRRSVVLLIRRSHASSEPVRSGVNRQHDAHRRCAVVQGHPYLSGPSAPTVAPISRLGATRSTCSPSRSGRPRSRTSTTSADPTPISPSTISTTATVP
jgi:hypothetical protein